jgi:hypothetical protein
VILGASFGHRRIDEHIVFSEWNRTHNYDSKDKNNLRRFLNAGLVVGRAKEVIV